MDLRFLPKLLLQHDSSPQVGRCAEQSPKWRPSRSQPRSMGAWSWLAVVATVLLNAPLYG